MASLRTDLDPHLGRAMDDGAVLAVPEGWLVDPLSVASLRAELATASPSCAGVVAGGIGLVPGTSYRVASERIALVGGPVGPWPGGPVAGAVLLRAEVRFRLEAGAVVVTGPLLTDPRAASFDPWQPTGPLEVASPAGRPPFPRRPVVLFLGLEVDPDVADWARATVNALVREDTEARLAVPEPTGGLHLTRPCRPVAASVAALVPDVVVALDERAGAAAGEWLGADRGATIVQLTEDTSAEVELVSWQIGRASGRLRARIGRGVGPATLSPLIRRLCAGPQPAPPREREPDGREGLGIRRASPRPRPRPPIVALVGGTAPAGRARFSHLAAHASAAGIDLVVQRLGVSPPAEATTAATLVLHDVAAGPATDELVTARRAAGLATVVDLARADLQVQGGELVLTAAAHRLVQEVGLALAPGPRARAAARRAGARALVVPTFPAPERVADLQQRRDRPREHDGSRLGWRVRASGAAATAVDRAVAAGIASWLTDRPDLVVEVVGDVERVDGLLPDHPRLHVAAGPPEIRRVRGWDVQLCSLPSWQAELDDETQPVIEAHLLGVPTFVPGDHPSVAEGLVPPGLAVRHAARPASWDAVPALLADAGARARRTVQVRHLADGLYGATAGASFVNRLAGWLGPERSA